MIFVGRPAPASSSSVASKIELAGRTVRSRNLAVPLMALSGVGGGALGATGGLTQPASTTSESIAQTATSIRVAARSGVCVSSGLQVACASQFAMGFFWYGMKRQKEAPQANNRAPDEKSCVMYRFAWAS